MLGLSKINFHLNICIYSSSAILAVSPSDNDNLSLAVSFTNCVIKDNRKGFHYAISNPILGEPVVNYSLSS